MTIILGESKLFSPANAMDLPVLTGWSENGPYAGRRIRAIAPTLCRSSWKELKISSADCLIRGWEGDIIPTYREVYNFLMAQPEDSYIRQILSKIRISITTGYEPGTDSQANESFCYILQDCADQIVRDIRDACYAFENPDIYYPGVAPGLIEPISDEHVEKSVWAMQRELKRELRDNGIPGGKKLPAAPITELPKRIKRALAERRRWRYAQWGITPEVWATGRFSWYDIHEDPDWVPSEILSWGGTPIVPMEDMRWHQYNHPIGPNPYTPPPIDEYYYD